MDDSWWHAHFIEFFSPTISLSSLLSRRVSFDRSVVNFMGFPLYASAFLILLHSVFCFFLHSMCMLRVFMFESIFTGTLRPLACGWLCFLSGKFLSMISSTIGSSLNSPSFPQRLQWFLILSFTPLRVLWCFPYCFPEIYSISTWNSSIFSSAIILLLWSSVEIFRSPTIFFTAGLSSSPFALIVLFWAVWGWVRWAGTQLAVPRAYYSLYSRAGLGAPYSVSGLKRELTTCKASALLLAYIFMLCWLPRSSFLWASCALRIYWTVFFFYCFNLSWYCLLSELGGLLWVIPIEDESSPETLGA